MSIRSDWNAGASTEEIQLARDRAAVRGIAEKLGIEPRRPRVSVTSTPVPVKWLATLAVLGAGVEFVAQLVMAIARWF